MPCNMTRINEVFRRWHDITCDFQMSDSAFDSESIQTQDNDFLTSSTSCIESYSIFVTANRADLFAQAQVDSLGARGFHPLLLSSRVFPWASGQQSSEKGKNCCLFLCLWQQYLDLISFLRSNLIILLFIQESHFHTKSIYNRLVGTIAHCF